MNDVRQEKIINVLYKNSILFTLTNINQWYFTKEEYEKDFLLEFEDNCGHFVLDCRVHNKKKISKTLEKKYINVEDILCPKTAI